jgi:Rieske Fe-S protein
MAADDPDRRKFLKVTTCALGAGAGLALVIPTLRLIAAPSGANTVTGPSEPLDLGLVDRLRLGSEPKKVEVIAPMVKDAWTAARDVVLGAAYLTRTGDKIEALSAVCPHLGCAVGWDAAAKNFLCPCHDSRFAADGARQTGPAERGLDPLPVTVKDGRLQLTWVRYRAGGSSREPV